MTAAIMATMRAIPLALAIALAAPALAAGDDWPTYGHDKGAMRFSPLDQITPDNVANLQPAWIYHMRPAATGDAPEPRLAGSQMTPLVIGNRMFITTPYSRVAALDATTGAEIWAQDIPGPGQPSLRGVEYWPGDGDTAPRIFFGTRDGRLIALDAASGAFAPGFGTGGVVNLRTAAVMNGFPDAPYGMTSPPLVVGNLVVTGSLVQEVPVRGAAGDVRAWDARSGELVWTFHAIPRPGEPGHDTWQPGSTEQRSGANAWGFLSADLERGIVYIPLGAPTYDRYGGDRKGDNLFSTSLVAVEAGTGRYLWHFQVVRHDIWDIDLQSAPLLFDAEVDGRTVPAVAVVAKNALLFLLDRVTGKPIHPVEERPVPPSDVPGELAAATQPFPVTPPLARTSFSIEDDIADLTPELKNWCEDWIRSNDMAEGGLYRPIRYRRLTITFPGTEGGASWGGMAFDPGNGYLFVYTNDFGDVSALEPSDGPMEYRLARGGGRFMKPGSGLMCQKPPWGRLSAVDTKTGAIAWQSVIGVTDSLPEALRHTGRHGIGGMIATAGGLVFIGATDDARFRAFDAGTGRELWAYRLGAAAHATPITYRGQDGRQYVAVTSTGGSYHNSPITSDALTAFALPQQGPRR